MYGRSVGSIVKGCISTNVNANPRRKCARLCPYRYNKAFFVAIRNIPVFRFPSSPLFSLCPVFSFHDKNNIISRLKFRNTTVVLYYAGQHDMRFLHGKIIGPFANIAHGCSSILADKVAVTIIIIFIIISDIYNIYIRPNIVFSILIRSFMPFSISYIAPIVLERLAGYII